MRTTLDLDEDVLSVLRALARQQRRGLGAVAGDLVRQALQPTHSRAADELPAFAVPAAAPLFGPEEVAAALAAP